jgi:hypothetical protein
MKNAAFIVLIYIAITAMACKNETQHEPELTRLVNPPIPALAPSFVNFEVDASLDTVFTIPGSVGTSITYRANSLTDSDGNTITGPVTFHYREFHDVYATVLAGIPMNYIENGAKEHFETAGMFELRAFKNGEPLSVKKDNSIGVKFGGKTSGDDFSFFYLDEESKKGWKMIGMEPAMVNEEKIELQTRIEKSKEKLNPIPFEKGHFVFNYQAAMDVFFNNDYSEIRKNCENKQIQKKIAGYGLSWIPAHTWENIIFKGQSYPAIMMAWKTKTSSPIPSWADYPDVQLKKINTKEYSLTLEDKKKGKKATIYIEPVMPLKSLFAFSADSWSKKHEQNMQIILEEEERMRKMAEVHRYFEINNFGIYNYDKFINTREAIALNADFNFNEAVVIKSDMKIFCSLNDSKGLMAFEYKDWNDFNIINSPDLKMFAILPPNKLVVLSPAKTQDAFKEIKEKGFKSYLFKMDKHYILDKPESLELALKEV